MTECIDEGRATGRADGPLHAAVVYDADDDLQVRTMPFLRAGLERGETILAVVPSRVELALRSALGSDGNRVHWRESALARRRTGEAYEECRAFLASRHAAAQPTRLLTGNDLDDAGPDRLAAYLRYEAASTAAFRQYGYPWVCLYDRRWHPAQLLEHVGEVHPQLLADDGRPVDSPDYRDPAEYLGSHDGPLSPLSEPPELEIAVARPAELRTARHHLAAYASAAGRFAAAADRIVSAAHEVISNALQHGRPPSLVRAWRSGDVLYVRVDDRGHAPGVAMAGYSPPPTPTDGGMGLWIVRQLTDVVHTRSSPVDGTAVELQFR